MKSSGHSDFGRGMGGVSLLISARKTALLCKRYQRSSIEKFNHWQPSSWSHANPVDLVAEMNTDIYIAIADELLQWEEGDAIIHMGIIGRRIVIKSLLESTIIVDKAYDTTFKNDSLELLKAYEHELVVKTVDIMGKYHKPVIGVYLMTDDMTRTVVEIDNEKYRGIVFPGQERAAKALAKM
jgi:hypothetical protein